MLRTIAIFMFCLTSFSLITVEVGRGEDSGSLDKTLPKYLQRWPGLYIRKGEKIVPAPEEDSSIARNYPHWPHKGPLIRGRRLTVMTAKTAYHPNEEVRVIHVYEAARPGRTVYIMGPKTIAGEYLDGQLVSSPKAENPLEPLTYDGVILPSPAVDYNFEITTYRFSQPGTHKIYWKIADLQSNLLVFEITER